MDKLLTPAEVASALRISVKTLNNWRCIGRHPGLPWINSGRRILYRLEVVQAFIESHTKTHTGA